MAVKTICCICGKVLREGTEHPSGGVSHGYCIPCAEEERRKAGLPPFTPEQIAEIKRSYES